MALWVAKALWVAALTGKVQEPQVAPGRAVYRLNDGWQHVCWRSTYKDLLWPCTCITNSAGGCPDALLLLCADCAAAAAAAAAAACVLLLLCSTPSWPKNEGLHVNRQRELAQFCAHGSYQSVVHCWLQLSTPSGMC
jgi:hypothetical protein